MGNIIFLVSNEPPPPFFIYGDQNVPLPVKIAREYLQDLNSWETVIFIFHENEFIPIYNDDSNKKITDFKYIFKYG
jgi:hypothetical protein